MLLRKFFIIITFLTFNLVHSQQHLVNPESAYFYSSTKSYFLSNFASGNIIKIDSNGIKSVFDEGLSHPCGIVICDSILYVVDNPKKVNGFNINNGKHELEIQIDEAVFLNDITYDNYNLYVTDTRSNAVFKINRKDKTYSLLVKTLMDGPNGIIYDKFNERLLVCYFRKNSTIDEINIKEASIKTLVSTKYDNLDGITLDELGNCYVSSFGPGDFKMGFKEQGTIYKYDKTFKNEPSIIITGLYGPADIYYNAKKKELVIPLFLSNKIEFLNIE